MDYAAYFVVAACTCAKPDLAMCFYSKPKGPGLLNRGAAVMYQAA